MDSHSDASQGSAKRLRGAGNSKNTVKPVTNDQLLDYMKKCELKNEERYSNLELSVTSKLTEALNTMTKSIAAEAKQCHDKYTVTTTKVNALETEIEKLQASVNNLDRIKKLGDVVIRNVPIMNKESKEDLKAIIVKVGNAVGIEFSLNDIIRIKAKSTSREAGTDSRERSDTRGGSSAKHPIIILSFFHEAKKVEFMSKYFALKSLNLTHLGFSSNTRI